MLTAPPIPRAQDLESANSADLAQSEIDSMIAQAAYYIAEQRGFEPGHEVDDWLQAEAQIYDQLAAHA